jgi:hypothetical protein
MAIDAGLHSDQEGVLLQNGSKQENLWGINFHPENGGGEDFIRSRGVDDPKIQAKIRAIVSKLVVL